MLGKVEQHLAFHLKPQEAIGWPRDAFPNFRQGSTGPCPDLEPPAKTLND